MTKDKQEVGNEMESKKVEPVLEKGTEVETLDATDESSVETDKEAIKKLKESVETNPFDWSESEGGKKNRFRGRYSDEDYNDLLSLYKDTIANINKGDLIKGKIIGVTNKDVIVDIGYKSDGLISFTEFRDITDGVKVGEEYDVYIEAKEDINGQLVLSRQKAKTLKTWQLVNEAFDKDEIIEGLVRSRTKGGLIIDVGGIDAFLPGSQIDVKPVRDFDMFLGKKMEFKVIKINQEFTNIIVSHKILIEKELEEQRKVIISKLEKGQILEGIVKNITDFGAFIDLGGVDGLLYITDISWTRIDHPSDVLELDQKINVVVLDFDDEKKRISLGLKQFSEHPWSALDETIVEGSKIKGKIVTITSYGFFVEISPGVEGLVHASEISWSGMPINPAEAYNIGDEIETVVLSIDREERKISMGIKQLTPDPWNTVEDDFEVGTKYSAIVRNITNFGVFVELKNGLSGLVHISDLSWTKKINHPNEILKIGEEVEIVILEIDKENQKLKLGYKQVDANPWETLETTFTLASLHEGTLTKVVPNGAIIELPYGMEGFAPTKYLYKEDDQKIEVGETLVYKVIEFDKNNRKIILSHTAIWKEEKVEKPKTGKKRDGKSSQNKEITKIQKSIEKTTLGEELTGLSDLMEQMKSSEKGKDKKYK